METRKERRYFLYLQISGDDRIAETEINVSDLLTERTICTSERLTADGLNDLHDEVLERCPYLNDYDTRIVQRRKTAAVNYLAEGVDF